MTEKMTMQFWSGNRIGKATAQVEQLAERAKQFNSDLKIEVVPFADLKRLKSENGLMKEVLDGIASPGFTEDYGWWTESARECLAKLTK